MWSLRAVSQPVVGVAAPEAPGIPSLGLLRAGSLAQVSLVEGVVPLVSPPSTSSSGRSLASLGWRVPGLGGLSWRVVGHRGPWWSGVPLLRHGIAVGGGSGWRRCWPRGLRARVCGRWGRRRLWRGLRDRHRGVEGKLLGSSGLLPTGDFLLLGFEVQFEYL